MRTEEAFLSNLLKEVFVSAFGKELPDNAIQIQPTRKEFEGDCTVVVFGLTRFTGLKPDETAQKLGTTLVENSKSLLKFNVVKGFLNLSFSQDYWLKRFYEFINPQDFTRVATPKSKSTVLVEYSSPNTNKPLHLGHLRNNFLGHAVARLLEANGHKVQKVQIINDRGIHICKSMLAWQKFGAGETPESTGLKGDHLVGKYYVLFDKEYKAQINDLVQQGIPKEEAERKAPILIEAQELLRKWEAGDQEVYTLWQTMNNWVYSGFNATYASMGVDFDKLYYESETYLLGKDEVLRGLKEGVFYRKEDGSIWVDLTDAGLDHKLLLRADGTAVYMTQDIGTAILRYNDFPDMSRQIYTVGNEQEYHFKVLFLILAKLGYSWAKNSYHLSYGMVELPEGKMKSREGTVVDADDLIAAMRDEASRITAELGKLEGMPANEQQALFNTIGLAALKYFILRVDPVKNMVFNPQESIDFNGNTGPFIQYTHARIKSLLRNANAVGKAGPIDAEKLQPQERSLIQRILLWPEALEQAAEQYNPAVMAHYLYDLVKTYNGFYQALPILKASDTETVDFRLELSRAVAEIVKSGMYTLGMEVPERM